MHIMAMGYQGLFTLSKAPKELNPLEISNVVDQEKMVKRQKLILENVFGRVFPNCAKRKFITTNYQHMVMEAQHGVDEGIGMRFGGFDS